MPIEIANEERAPRYQRAEGIVSYLLSSPRTCSAVHLTTTLVEIEPGGEQRIHSHEPEQVYFVLDGTGWMTVGEDREEVRAGDCVFVPSRASHGIRNAGDTRLRYLSAAAPAFASEQLRALWPLPAKGGGR